MKPFVYLASTAFLGLSLAGCSPSNGGNNAASNSNTTNVNEATGNEAIVPSASSTPSSTKSAKVLPQVWVPGSDDKLHLKSVSKEALDTQKKFGDPTAAIAEVVRMSPKLFPPKTKVLDYHDDGKSVSVNLNREFEGRDFWSKAGEGQTQLAVYAIVNTAASVSNKPVVLKVDNRPLSALGEFDASDAIEPDKRLQAGAGSDTSKSGGA